MPEHPRQRHWCLIDFARHGGYGRTLLRCSKASIAESCGILIEVSILAPRKAVFVVDDDPGMLRSVKRLLKEYGFDAVVFDSVEAFQRQANLDEAFCVILDINLNDGSGIELRRRLADGGISLPVIFITGNDSDATREAALASGCSAYLTKPFPAQSLIDPVQKASAALA